MSKKISELVADGSENTQQTNELAAKILPWLFGAGIAGGHLLTASNCTIPQTGKCAICGGCVVALGSLVAWAMIKKKNGDDFYSQRDDD
jgi:hypothetical protein